MVHGFLYIIIEPTPPFFVRAVLAHSLSNAPGRSGNLNLQHRAQREGVLATKGGGEEKGRKGGGWFSCFTIGTLLDI